jgi:transposase
MRENQIAPIPRLYYDLEISEHLVDRHSDGVISVVPPALQGELSDTHLCSFLRHTVAMLNLKEFQDWYREERRSAYAPEMLLSIWLYAYVLMVTSSRQLEQRIRKDPAFRYASNGALPDHRTLSAFRRQHRKELNDVFTQVTELARADGFSQLGLVAIDSTRVGANASRNRIEAGQARRDQRARIRREIRFWQQRCDAQDSSEGVRLAVRTEELVRLGQ